MKRKKKNEKKKKPEKKKKKKKTKEENFKKLMTGYTKCVWSKSRIEKEYQSLKVDLESTCEMFEGSTCCDEKCNIPKRNNSGKSNNSRKSNKDMILETIKLERKCLKEIITKLDEEIKEFGLKVIKKMVVNLLLIRNLSILKGTKENLEKKIVDLKNKHSLNILKLNARISSIERDKEELHESLNDLSTKLDGEIRRNKILADHDKEDCDTVSGAIINSLKTDFEKREQRFKTSSRSLTETIMKKNLKITQLETSSVLIERVNRCLKKKVPVLQKALRKSLDDVSKLKNEIRDKESVNDVNLKLTAKNERLVEEISELSSSLSKEQQNVDEILTQKKIINSLKLEIKNFKTVIFRLTSEKVKVLGIVESFRKNVEFIEKLNYISKKFGLILSEKYIKKYNIRMSTGYTII